MDHGSPQARALGLAYEATATPIDPIVGDGFCVTRDRGDRKRLPQRPLLGRYDAVVFALSLPYRRGEPDAGLTLRMQWQGNAYGEIRDARATVDADHGAFGDVRLVVDVRTTPSDARPAGDPRGWPLRFAYVALLTIPAAEAFGFGGTFEIDAFGGYVPIERSERGASAAWTTLLVAGPRIDAPAPAVPFDAVTGGWNAPNRRRLERHDAS